MNSMEAIAKQRGKTVLLMLLLGFIQTMVHPETAMPVWGALGLAVGALASMEAWASRESK